VHVKTLCLAVLSMGDASGYEIKKLLEGPFRHIHEASFGAIYPALAPKKRIWSRTRNEAKKSVLTKRSTH
jgi:hypothetical protein